MKYFICFIILLGYTTAGSAQYLEQFLWKKRVIVVYENVDRNNDTTAKQLAELHSPSKLKERKLQIFTFDGITLQSIYPEIKIENSHNLGISFQHDFEVILIGLDGSIKSRSSEIQNSDLIFDFIDSMPMRRSEIRKKDQK